MHDISLRICRVGPRARAHGVAMCMCMAKTCTCAWLLKLSIGFFLSFDNIDNKVKNLVKIDLSDKIR